MAFLPLFSEGKREIVVKPRNPNKLSNAIENTHFVAYSKLSCILEIAAQNIFRDIRDVIGYSLVTEPRLQLACRWIIENAIDQEKEARHIHNAIEN